MMWYGSILFAWRVLSVSASCSTIFTTEHTSNTTTPCACYLISGSYPGYFQHYRYWDFRNIPSADNDTYIQAPAVASTAQTGGGKSFTSEYFNSSTWQDDWSIQDGPQSLNAFVPSYNSAQNVYMSRNTTQGSGNATFLTLRTLRLPSYMSIAEIQSTTTNILYSSIRTRARVIPNDLSISSAPFVGTRKLENNKTGSTASHLVDSGAVFGFFTYFSDSQEMDTEILSKDSISQVHYSAQPAYNHTTNLVVENATKKATLPGPLRYTEWVDYRMDWFEGVCRWYVNDKLVRENTVNAPSESSTLILNLWGDGGTWSGRMSPGGQVTVGIEWIEMVYNVSSVNEPAGGADHAGINRNGYCKKSCIIA